MAACPAHDDSGLALPNGLPEAERLARQARVDHKRVTYELTSQRPPYEGGSTAPLVDTGVLPWLKSVPAAESTFGDAQPALLRLTSIGFKLQHLQFEDWLERIITPATRFDAPFAVYEWLLADNLPYMAKNSLWRCDYEYGYEKFNGIVPVQPRRMDAVPAHLKGLEAAVGGRGLLPQGKSLAQLIAAGRVFFIDHSALKGLPVDPDHADRPLYPSTLVLVEFKPEDPRPARLPHDVRDAPPGTLLRPVAIQLDPVEGAIVTPLNPVPGLWLAYKLHASAADLSHVVFYEHMLMTHILNEGFWSIMNRTMDNAHPLLAVMQPHMHVTLFIGEQFRQTSYWTAKGTLTHLHACGLTGGWDLMRRELERAGRSWHVLDQRRYFKDRGTDKVSGYLFRDDSIAHYELIHEYCASVAERVYCVSEDGAPGSPADRDAANARIEGDAELQAFVTQYALDTGFKDLPVDEDGVIRRVSQVALLLAGPIWTAGVKHSMVDNAAYTYYSFAPNAPLSFSLKPAVTEAEVAAATADTYTDANISKHLLQNTDANLQVALVRANYPIHPPDEGSGWFDHFRSILAHNGQTWSGLKNRAIFPAYEQWGLGLQELGEKIRERNASHDETHTGRPAFSFLGPDHMSNSVWY